MPKKVESWLWLRHPYPFYCEKMCFWLHAETNLTLGTSITCITLILFIRGLSADNGKRVEPVKKRLNHSSRRPDCCFPKFELISNYNSWKSLGCLHLWNLLNLTKLIFGILLHWKIFSYVFDQIIQWLGFKSSHILTVGSPICTLTAIF